MMMRFLRVLVAVTALVVVVPAAVFAHAKPVRYAASQRFGSADGSVDTPAKVRALMGYLNSRTPAQLQAEMRRFSPADRQTIIRLGLKVKAVATQHHAVSATVSAHQAHPITRRTVAVVATGKDAVGLTLYRYISEWSWCYNGSVVSCASHHEYSDKVFPGWQYDSSQNLTSYGQMNSWYVGREVIGTFHFGFSWFSVYSYPKIQAQVNGAGGYWDWWNINGSL